MTTVVLAEKPSVARDIARVLGVRGKGEGCWQGNGYAVTWALGHLVQFAEPDEYGPPWNERWSMDQLPIVPQEWKLKTDRRTSKQFQIVRKLINAADTAEIVVATDAGREGEHIFRLIYEHARCRKPFRRLWISSLTDSAIRQGLAQLRPGTAFDDLAAAARTRAQADWLVGMNLTRAYTVHNKALCTIGRVQTPTLAMLVERELEIARFQKTLFYELVASLHEGFSAKYSKDGQTRIDRKEAAEQLHQRLSPHRTGTVVGIEKNVRRHRPPALYNLVELQRDANRRFGLTAAQVLEHAQSLYETHKLITYPRTESRHLSEDMVPQLPQILAKLDHPQAPAALARLRQGLSLGKAYVDQNKLTDHHAIIPTEVKPPPNLPSILRRVYDLVAARFVAIFLPDQVVEETQVVLQIGGETFIARGARVLEEGWKVVEPRRPAGPPPEGAKAKEGESPDGEEEEESQSLPPLEKGQQVHVERLEVVEKETKPPRRYSDATLLAAMKNAGRQVEDEALAAAMKESGLGTPATRAEIIERLIRSGFVERQKKNLAPTEKGQALIGAVAEPLRRPELTAAWEQRLKDVEEGRLAADQFYCSIVAFVEEMLPQVAQSPALPPQVLAGGPTGRRRKGRSRDQGGKGRGVGNALGVCPVCKQGTIVENAKAYGCSRYREGCKFVIWKRLAGKELTEKQARDLLEQGRTARLEGFTARSGRPFAARLRLDDSFKVVFDFAEESPEKPTASENRVSPGDRLTPENRAAPENQAAPEKRLTPENQAVPEDRAAPEKRLAPEDRAASKSPIAPENPSPAREREPLACPKCGRGRIIEGKRGYGCNRFREGCDFVIWKEIAGKRLTENQIHQLIEKGKTRLLKGFQSKAGNSFQARLRLGPGWKVEFEFEERK